MRHILMAAIAFYPASAAASAFERFDVPGATSTCGAAIASDGLVAGFAGDSSIGVGNTEAGRAAHQGPFLYRSGRTKFLKPDVPAGWVVFTGVNRSRAVTGIDVDSASFTTQTFLYSNGVTSFPAISQGTVESLVALTDTFTVLGRATVPGPPPFNSAWVGFLQTASGAVTLIDDGSGAVQPAGMDQNAGYVVGSSLNGNGAGWVFHDGVFTPIAVPGGSFTLPSGVDSKGNVAGSYITGTTPNLVVHGFRLRNGVYTTWDVPGADSTSIAGMNERGQITGCFTKNGKTTGYIFTP
jgi:hypothetical protein